MSNSRKTKTRRDSDSIDFKELNCKRIKLSNENNSETEDNKISNDASLGNISEQILSVERDLVIELGKIVFHSPIEYVYSPLEYAFNIHTMYVQKYCNTIKKILFLGMNPGPWGMSQTGVPFGEISMVRDWLKICGPVGKPVKEQPNRKVTGFQCNRSEISGKRLWSLFQKLCGSPEKFFQQAYIHNYCPIALMKKNGCNITPAEIKGSEIQTLHSSCDKALLDIIKIIKAEIVIGIGGYAEKRAQFVIQSSKLPIKVLCLPHPSPRAVNNKNWSEKATKKLSEFGLLERFIS
ncbi:single-strand selective monofunctional uracil DNA glycosylase [Apis mellifera]|uniref:Single-strand selective monofunctional uracil DNA glycosylase n=1 Tax=Apis mellifera TaxID=7460 RepID=A0A7M7LNB9_APIME|nr:single-strand selective monofunctional uracil DNA glycosylase [Apis mellifera]|eukprot:XP_006564278.1 single-strand selective monofunctional uracil DNA glycosylase [Apis mellifera]